MTMIGAVFLIFMFACLALGLLLSVLMIFD